MAEANFLASQKARTDNLHKSGLSRDRSMQIHRFWRDWKADLAEWTAKLENLNDKELSDLSEDLHAMRKRASGTEFLPLADLRLLHKDLTACQEQYDAVKGSSKPKFRFRRYRQAMQQQRAQCSAREVTGEEKKKPSIPALEESLQSACTLQDLENQEIMIHADGRVTGMNDPKKLQGDALVLRNLQHCTVHV